MQGCGRQCGYYHELPVCKKEAFLILFLPIDIDLAHRFWAGCDCVYHNNGLTILPLTDDWYYPMSRIEALNLTK